MDQKLVLIIMPPSNRLAIIIRALMLFASRRCVVAPIGLWLCSETAY